MAAIKSYTDLEQSKKLAEILPIESADEWLTKFSNQFDSVPCWSLISLLSILPKGTRLLKSLTDDTYRCDCSKGKGNISKWFDNPIDACVEMILMLHEQRLL